ncbi:MAG: cytochrome b/b6 domain-containing protein, partial [Gammaproteobacteria bacterium]
MSTNSQIAASGTPQKVYVYDLPLRLWHWFNALAVALLCITGYLIASPPVVSEGEAVNEFLMGYIRFAHFSAGYLLAVGFLFRFYWAWAGNEHARQLFWP